jgi:hypothetical protein
VVRIASPLLNNVAEFEPAPLAAGWAVSLVSVALPILLIGAALRLRRRSRDRGRGGLAVSSPLPSVVRRLADGSPWIIIGTVAAWLAALFSGVGSGLALSSLHLLTIAATLSALALAAEAGASWRDGARSVTRSIETTTLALAALTSACLFLSFGLAGL